MPIIIYSSAPGSQGRVLFPMLESLLADENQALQGSQISWGISG